MGIQSEISARLPGPVAGQVAPFTVGTNHAVYTIPEEWKGRHVDLTAWAPALNSAGQAAAIWCAFGTSALMEADRTVRVGGVAPAFTMPAAGCVPIRDGEHRDWFVDPSWTHMAFEADLANCVLTITPSAYTAPGA